MDKNAIRKFAVWARRELIARVSQRAERFGITETTPGDPHAESVNGHLLTDTERRQRAALIARIQKNGYKAVMEEAAYTWFNRFCALRFMEVNGFLPTRIRVFTDEQNGFHPQILAEAIHMELDGLDMERVYQLKSDSDDEALYKYLLITQCNALCSILPGMFTPIADYTGLLMPDNLLREGSVIEQMIALIPEADWLDQVQIIGWLYQYYNVEPKDEVFANLKKNIKIGKRDIPAATQLFTPDWIVRYMVENSLGRLWVEGHPDEALKAGWRYYLEEAEQEPQVQQALARIRAEYAQMKPEDIRCIDPCMGSGHILVYMFDVLLQIYQAYGYSTREAVQSILQNNLYGLDIDDRAAQLAYFAVMMKARQVDRRFFSRGIQPHVRAIAESGDMPKDAFALFGPQQDIARRVYAAFVDAKEYGSLIEPNVTLEELDALDARLCDMDEMAPYGSLSAQAVTGAAMDAIWPLMEQARVLVQKYDVVVTNPPYMGSSGMGARLSDYVKASYPDSKSDLFAVFIERCGEMTRENGYQAMITQHAWMFLSSFEMLRAKLLKVDTVNMAHLGARAFEEIGGEVVQTTSFVLGKRHIAGYKGTYARLIEPTTQQGKEDMFLAGQNRFVAQQDNFSKIPGAPVAYWVSKQVTSLYENSTLLGKNVETKQGLKSSDDKRFFRYWIEVDYRKIDFSIRNKYDAEHSKLKWVPLNKGGSLKWFGDNWYVINWENNGEEIKEYAKSLYKSVTRTITSIDYYFQKCITWPQITSSPHYRSINEGFIFNAAGPSMFVPENLYLYVLGFLNTPIIQSLTSVLNPTVNLTVSIGVSFSKILAKLGSDMKKPDAITVLDTEHWRERVWQLPVSDLLFVGSRTAKKLMDRNVLTIGDLAHTDPQYLRSWFGKNGIDLWITANGEDRYRIKPDGYEEPIKSVGHGITCNADLHSEDEVWKVILDLSQDIGHRLRCYGLSARGVRVCVRDNELGYEIAQAQLSYP